MAGFRASGNHDNDPLVFYTFPAAFEQEVANGFNPKQFARVLVESGTMTQPASGRGYQRKSPRINKRQYNVYVIQYHRPEDAADEE